MIWVWAGAVVAAVFVVFTAGFWLHARDKQPSKGEIK